MKSRNFWNFENYQFLHQQNSLFESKSTKMNLIIWRTEPKLNPIRHLWIMSDWNMSFWVDHISNQVPSKQIKSQLCNLKHFVIQKLKILDFHFNCLWGVLTNRPSIWRNFTCWNLKIIDIPSLKQNNAKGQTFFIVQIQRFI